MSPTIECGRIDMFVQEAGIRIMKWPVDWLPGTPPVISYVNTDLSLDEMTNILEAKGWTVRCWHGGARAWKDKIRPIRTRAQIIRKRESFTRYPRPGIQLCCVDFAFDC